MTAYRTQAQNRTVALLDLVILVATLAIALILNPLQEWGVWDAVLGGIVAALAIYSAYLLLTGKSDSGIAERGFARARQQRVLSLVAIGLLTLAMAMTILANSRDAWTANDILLIGLWTYLIVGMLSYFAIANAQLQREA